MKKRYWYYKNGKEEYNVLYESDRYILVQNAETKKFSFGVRSDFNSFYGFPVNQSCLLKDDCIEKLYRFIEIDTKYADINDTIKTWQTMIDILKETK